MAHIARLRKLNAAYAMLKEDDPNTYVSKNYIRILIKTVAITVHQAVSGFLIMTLCLHISNIRQNRTIQRRNTALFAL